MPKGEIEDAQGKILRMLWDIPGTIIRVLDEEIGMSNCHFHPLAMRAGRGATRGKEAGRQDNPAVHAFFLLEGALPVSPGTAKNILLKNVAKKKKRC
ncbi:MAG: hypothetical protein VB099_10120 [Candidatus Limiplasma sp.]|nr:hypothetical protein [Candidatus Limiplasma sp.]